MPWPDEVHHSVPIVNIQTPEERMAASHGDWPDIAEATHEPAETND